MSKAKIKPDLKAVQKIVNLAVSPNTASKQLRRQLNDKQAKLMDQLVGLGRGKGDDPNSVAGITQAHMVKDLQEAIGVVEASLKTGLPGAASGGPFGMPPLTPNWVARKRKESKDVFWRNTGKLARNFMSFSRPYGRKLQNATYEIRTQRAVFGKPFIYRITFRIPAHPEFNVLNAVIPFSYADGLDVDHSTFELKGTTGAANIRIGYLEGTGPWNKTHRPFISKLMAARGQAFRNDIVRIAMQASDKVNRKGGLSFKVK